MFLTSRIYHVILEDGGMVLNHPAKKGDMAKVSDEAHFSSNGRYSIQPRIMIPDQPLQGWYALKKALSNWSAIGGRDAELGGIRS